MAKAKQEPDGAAVIKEALSAAGARPNQRDSPEKKILYAGRFADKMAEAIARDLTPRLLGIRATTKREGSSVQGKKQLDVNFSTPQLGLALGISLKSVHIRDVRGAERYTHNMKRNEEELRIEASGYHKRQPYAVMIGVLFLPFDSCEDGKRDNPSSFGSFVRKLRPYAGRTGPHDESDRFEKIFVALYDSAGTDLRFFDIENAPPRNGRPKDLVSYGEFLEAAYHQYLKRNSAEFAWADGEPEPLDTDEIGSPAGEED